MADPYLASDESVILATDRVEHRSKSLSALVMTNRRVLLISAAGESITADEILFTKLRTATVDTRVPEKPALVISSATETGDIREDTLAFTPAEGKSRMAECKEWAEKLKEQIVPSLEEPVRAEPAPPATARPIQKEAAPVENATPVPAAETVPGTSGDTDQPEKTTSPVPPPVSSGGILAKHDRPSGFAFPKIPDISVPEINETPAQPAPKRSLKGVAILVVAIIAVLAIALLFTQFLPGKPVEKAQVPPTVSPMSTTIRPTTVPTTVPTTMPAVTETQPVPTPSETTPQQTVSAVISPTPVQQSAPGSQIPIPEEGVWVYVQYPGNFTGSYGVDGGLRDVSGNGNTFLRIWTKTGVAKAMITKGDRSKDILTVTLYNNGQVVESGRTGMPLGEVNIQFDLRVLTPVPTLIANVTAS